MQPSPTGCVRLPRSSSPTRRRSTGEAAAVGAWAPSAPAGGHRDPAQTPEPQIRMLEPGRQAVKDAHTSPRSAGVDDGEGAWRATRPTRHGDGLAIEVPGVSKK